MGETCRCRPVARACYRGGAPVDPSAGRSRRLDGWIDHLRLIRRAAWSPLVRRLGGSAAGNCWMTPQRSPGARYAQRMPYMNGEARV